MNALRAAAAVVLCLSLTACSLIGDKRSELSVWGLDAALPSTDGAPVAWQLVIDEPAAAGPLAGTRIALAPGAGEWGVYRGARWDDSAPRMVQTLLLRGFEDSQRIVGVGRAGESVRGDFLLLTELRAFHVERGDAERALVSIGAKLVRFGSNEVIAARVFQASAQVDGSGIAAVVAAFQQASAEVLPALVSWTLDTGATSAAPGSANPG